MLISAGLRHSLYELFTGMSVATFILVALGLMLVVIEFFQPAHTVPTYCGVLLILCGITVRMLSGGTIVMLFFMVLFCVIVILAAHVLMLITQKKAWLTASLALKLQRTVESDSDYAHLLGCEGVATTDISGNGHMSVGDVNFFVCGDEFIPKGTAVRVVHVAGTNIKVAPMYESNE